MSGFAGFRVLVPGLLALLLTGCHPFSDARPMMTEYVERLARVLELEPKLSPIATAEPMPRRRDRVLALPDLDMGMLDFLSLYGCELQYVVGKKNSVMGRVMQPLNRLRYELRFIQSARKCLPEVEDEKLAKALETAITSKIGSLPIAVWNATWGTAEIEQLFTLSKGEYPVSTEGNPVADLAREVTNLNTAVSAVLEGDLTVSLAFAGAVQQRWQAEHRAGQLLNSALVLAARLQDATSLLRMRIQGRPLCLNGKPNQQSDIVQGLFFSVYIDKVQPYMSDVQRARTALIKPFETLAAMQRATMPEAFLPWYRRYLSSDADASVWRQLDAAMIQHTKAWQALLEQCGLRPGA